MWIGCDRGLLRFDAESLTVLDDFNFNAICPDQVFSIQPDPKDDDILWLGTNSSGLIEYNTRVDTLHRYKFRQEQNREAVYGLLFDNSGTLWLAASSGFYSFDPDSHHFRRHGVSKELFTMGFNHGAVYKNSAGELFWGGPKGMIAFDPQQMVEKSNTPPKTYMTRLEINNSPITIDTPNSPLTGPLYAMSRLSLNHKQRNFAVTFAANDYMNPELNQFSWILRGFEDQWHQASTRRQAVYTNVPYGTYELAVKARNADDVWSEQPKSLTIIISPPWWRTWWAMLIWTALAGLFLWRSITFLIERRELVLNVENQRQRADLLKQVDELKTRFFDYISHEFRTPLSMIISPVDELENATTDKHHKGRLALIRSSANLLLDLVNQILELSKIDAHKYPVKLVLGDMASFVEKNVTLFSSHAQHQDVRLTFDAEPQQINAYFDADILTKILNNLLSNALKFTPAGGRITVSLFRAFSSEQNETKFITLKVTDTGIGIPKEDIPTLFDRFSHANKLLKRPGQGIGLGLSFVKELLQLLHSDIEVESIEGKGTTVTVSLADLQQHFKAGTHLDLMDFVSHDKPEFQNVLPSVFENASDEILAAEKEDSPPFTVLIIEDDDKLRHYIVDVLTADFVVHQASNGEEGVEKAKSMHLDIILCDIKMPQMDGFEVTRLLKADEHTAAIPVILLTAKTDAESLKLGWQAGADDYIAKPFKATHLIGRIYNILEQRARLKKSFSTAVSLKPQEITANPVDQKFLDDVLAIIEKHMDDEAFDVQKLARQIGLSQSQLARRLNSLLNKPTVKVIQSVRMQRAAQLLRSGCCSISEASYKVGFNNPSYFTKAFRAEFDCSPQEYVKRYKA